ncbi:MAG: hydroxyacid dehydrogenase [Tidjanibacter sp.]|nr:hydroxyacid dehydrogenase [Tidjanibacter sp.]
MKPNIVFLDAFSLGGADLSSITKLGNYTEYQTSTPADVVERCQNADIVITNKVPISAEAMDALPCLKLICVAATGMNNIDLPAAAERGIIVRNAVGYSTETVAETTIGDAIALLRQVAYYDNYVKSGEYAASPRWINFDRKLYSLNGKNWGIIGLGNIGRRVAHLAEAFNCSVAYHSTSGVAREEKYEQKSLSELLSWADILSIHCPLSEKTRGLIGAEELQQMKPTAILINVARGGIVDEAALADALNNGIIAGAGIDTYSIEPMKADNPLLALKDPYKLIASPHNAWAATEAIDNLVGCIADNIKSWFIEAGLNCSVIGNSAKSSEQISNSHSSLSR